MKINNDEHSNHYFLKSIQELISWLSGLYLAKLIEIINSPVSSLSLKADMILSTEIGSISLIP